MPILLLATIVIPLPLQAQLLTPLAPAPVIPSTTPSTVFPRGRDRNCPDGTALNQRLGRCLPTQQGRTLPSEEGFDKPTSNTNASSNRTTTAVPLPPSIAKQPNAQQLVQEAVESCQAYPGTVPTPIPGGYACVLPK